MEKKEFQTFCHNEFTMRGFRKVRSMYYLDGNNGILCGLWLKNSNYGPKCCVQYFYFLGNYPTPKDYPVRYDFDLSGMIQVMSKTTYKGEYFRTAEIEYEKYTTAELQPYFEHAFATLILPPVQHGKAYLMANHDHLRFPPLKEKTQILDKLCVHTDSP